MRMRCRRFVDDGRVDDLWSECRRFVDDGRVVDDLWMSCGRNG
jgi:hypothetical protein